MRISYQQVSKFPWLPTAFAALSIGLFIFGAGLASKNQLGAAASVFAAATLCAVFAFLTRFKRVSGFGVEMELWQQKMEEAAHLVESLRNLTKVASQAIMTIGSRVGRWDAALSIPERHKLHEDLQDLMKAANLSDKDIKEALTEHYRLIFLELFNPIRRTIGEEIDKEAGKIERERRALGSHITDEKRFDLDRLIDREKQLHQLRSERDSIVNQSEKLAKQLVHKLILNMSFLTTAEYDKLLENLTEDLDSVDAFANRREFLNFKKWIESDLT
ncbi:MAG: hypothetical protein WD044_12525 [Dongiaceae bacterium]